MASRASNTATPTSRTAPTCSWRTLVLATEGAREREPTDRPDEDASFDRLSSVIPRAPRIPPDIGFLVHHWGTRAEPDEPSDHAIPRPRLDSSVPAPFRVLAASGERESIEQLRVSLTIPSVAKGTTRPPANDCVPAEAAPDAMLSGALEAPAVAGLPVASSALAPRPAAPAELPGRVGLTSLRLRWFVLAVVLGVLAGLLLAWAIQLAVS